jgi:hypothetical protein
MKKKMTVLPQERSRQGKEGEEERKMIGELKHADVGMGRHGICIYDGSRI